MKTNIHKENTVTKTAFRNPGNNRMINPKNIIEAPIQNNMIQLEIDIDSIKRMIVTQRICVAEIRCMNIESKRKIQRALSEIPLI